MAKFPEQPPRHERVRVVVTDFDISFTQLVYLLVKLALAVLPALVILLSVGVIGVLMFHVLGRILGVH